MRLVGEVMAEVLRVPLARLVDDLEFGGIPEWDSLTHVDLMLALEAEFGVTIDEEKMIELTSVRAIRLFIPEPK